MKLPTVVRLPEVCKAVGASRPSIWRWVKSDPAFPQPFKLGANSTGWDASEIAAWVEARKSLRKPTLGNLTPRNAGGSI